MVNSPELRRARQARTAKQIARDCALHHGSKKTKRCCGCKKELRFAQFYADKALVDGLQKYCKKCSSEARSVTEPKRRRARQARTAREIAKDRKLRHGSKTVKMCTGCKNELPFCEFYVDKAMADGLNNYCKKCTSDAHSQQYSKFKALRTSLKEHRVCPRPGCGWTGDVSGFVFAHRDRSTKRRNSVTGCTQNPSKVQTIAKLEQDSSLCEVICANCHNHETQLENQKLNSTAPNAVRQREAYAAATEFVNAEKRRRGECLRCKLPVSGRYCFSVFEFDHRPGEKKIDGVGRLLRYATFPVLTEEMAKCDLLCARCHRIVTAERVANGIHKLGRPRISSTARAAVKRMRSKLPAETKAKRRKTSIR